MAQVTLKPEVFRALLASPGSSVNRGIMRRVERAIPVIKAEAPEFSTDLVDSIDVVSRNRKGQFAHDIVVDVPYASFVIRGIPPGIFPPYKDTSSPFVAWANAKGIPPYVLARHIFLNGIEPNDFLTRGLRSTGRL